MLTDGVGFWGKLEKRNVFFSEKSILRKQKKSGKLARFWKIVDLNFINLRII